MAIEVVLLVDCRSEEEIIKRILPMLEAELRMGATSFFHASRIMEVKGLTLDEKAALVQDKVTQWVHRNPDFFDVDLIYLMQEFFLLSRDNFKAIRDVSHLSKMVVVFYTFSKRLKRGVETESHRRHLFLKISPTTLQSPLSPKKVLGICVGMNFLRHNEVFEEAHLLKAVRNCLSQIECVRGATYVDRSHEEKIQTIYIEIERTNRRGFALHEIKELKQRLLDEVRSHVECLVSPIFMPRNEEEVMRNIVTLSQQIRFVRDLPQVILSFDHQSDTAVHFTVVMVSLTPGLGDAFNKNSESLEFTPERVKTVGQLRNRHPKEAVVLKVQLKKSPFLRDDHSLDLYAARQHVLDELQKEVGEVRDYNGGMLAKQVENFKALQSIMGPIAQKHRFLLENFFYSLFPVEVRSLLSPPSMKTLFFHLLSLHLEKNAEKNQFEFSDEKGAIFALIGLQDAELKERVIAAVNELNLRWPNLVFLHQHVFETTYLGYIFFSEDEERRKSFLELLRGVVTACINLNEYDSICPK